MIGTEDKFSWIAGFYYFNEIGYQNDPVLSGFFGSGILTPAALATEVFSPGAFKLGALDSADNTSIAGYAHATFHATDQVDIAGGLRFTNDQRTYGHLVPGNVFTQHADFSNTDWDASVTYKFTPDVSAYAKVSTGYLAGGSLGGRTFQPEANTSYEMGLKSEFFDRRLRANLVGFYQHVTNIQVTEFDTTHGTYIINGANENIPGVELELRALPLPGLQLTANYGYQRTPTNIDPVSGNKILSLYPSQNLALGVEYDTQPIFADAYASFRLDAIWTSDHPNLQENLTTPIDIALQQATTTPAQWMLNGRVSLSDIPLGETHGRVSLWVTNLLDNRDIAFAREIFFAVGQFQVPRTFGADLSIDF